MCCTVLGAPYLKLGQYKQKQVISIMQLLHEVKYRSCQYNIILIFIVLAVNIITLIFCSV